ncbi:putative small G-protein Ras2 [Xylaria venustula]|nr:putative small G-protein Ras2 [Xylaria venustula]
MQPGPLVPLVAVLGDSGVGKIALVTRLYCQEFIGSGYDPTIEESYRISPKINNQTVPLELLDTAGHESYRNLQDQWIKQADGIILVYSVTERNTFRTIRHLVEEVLAVKVWRTKDKAPDTVRRERLPIMIVGNKSDMSDEREVNAIEGHTLARENGSMFIETSAKHNCNVQKAVSDVVKVLPKSLCQDVSDDAASPKSSVWMAWWTTLLDSGCCIFM